jgi:hypothetical protein
MSPKLEKVANFPIESAALIGGAGRIRTGDPLLAKQVLCQLSYDPKIGRSAEKERFR